MNSSSFQPPSLKSKTTVFTLLMLVLSIWALALYASRTLRQDMQALLGQHQFSTVSFIAAHVNQDLADRLQGL